MTDSEAWRVFLLGDEAIPAAGENAGAKLF
jgi:hypothetical protein